MNRIIVLCLVLSVLLSTACCQNKNKQDVSQSTSLLPLHAKDNFNYAGSYYKGNYIWGGAMNLAWTELTDNIVKDTIRLNTTDPLTLATLAKLNKPVITKRDLDEASYYVKSGFGPETQDTINRESRIKFPSKSFADLDYDLSATDIISYAYFLKQVEYQIAFPKKDVKFNGKLVEGFLANDKSCENIYILDYQNEDKFLIGIKLKDSEDQLFLAKGYPMDLPDSLVAMLRKKAPAQSNENYNLGAMMDERDVFQAPFLSLSHVRDYVEMLNKVLQNKIEDREYYISIMKEKIKFRMDEKGARVENEGVIILRETSVGPGHSDYKPKIMKLDKPYWVVMKRFDSNNPYFILGINNTELMKAAEE